MANNTSVADIAIPDAVGLHHLEPGLCKDIPLLCIEDLAEEGQSNSHDHGFFRFPCNYKWTIATDGSIESTPDSYSNEPHYGEAFNRLIQRWLFFELLREIFGVLDGFRYAHFYRDAGATKYISTQRLPEYLTKWKSFEESRKIKYAKRNKWQTQRFVHIQRVLTFARSLVVKNCSVTRANVLPSWQIDDRIALSLMILGETLTRAHIMIQDSCNFKMAGWHNHEYRNQGWGDSKHALLKLEEQWCRKSVAMLQAIMRRNSIGLMYLASLNIQTAQTQHEKCSYDQCHLESPSPAEKAAQKGMKHKLRHSKKCEDKQRRDIDEQCSEVKVESKDIARIIERGGVPLLKFHSASKKIELVAWEQGDEPPEYHIFSHVWTDHFGDQDQNKVNLCQLIEFMDIFSRIRKRNPMKSTVGDRPTNQELFWIDTLTIPNGEEFRKERTAAIQTMHHVYQRAKNTIVLDNSLMDQDKGVNYAEAAIKITMSAWMRRLWTLQEAAFSQSIWFVFSGGVCHMEELESDFIKENKSLSSGLAEVSRAYHDMMLGSLRTKILSQGGKYSVDPEFVSATWKASQWRTTSQDHHETLALAILFQLDVESFLSSVSGDQEPNEIIIEKINGRMRKLLDLLSRERILVPSGMIFLPGAPLTGKGYSWAPRTWLSARDIDSPDPLLLTVQKPAALIKGAGLEVVFPGFLLHPVAYGDRGRERDRGTDDPSEYEPRHISLSRHKHIRFPSHYTLLEWYTIEAADGKSVFPDNIDKNIESLAIINPRLPLVNPKEIALLVSIVDTTNESFEVHILCRVWVSRVQNLAEVEELKGYHEKGNQAINFIGEQLNSKKWVVDGPQEPRSKSSMNHAQTLEPNGSVKPKRVHTFPNSFSVSFFDRVRNPFKLGRRATSNSSVG